MDGDPDEQADDLLPLPLGQSGVEVGAQLGEQVNGRLGQFRGVRGPQGGHAPLQLRLLGGDPLELGSQIVLASHTADHQPDGSLPLPLERLKRPGEGDRLGHGHRSLGVALGLAPELGEGVARIAKPALDVRPHLWLDRVRPDRATPAAAGEGTALDQLAVAAIPAHVVAAVRADVGEAVETAADDSPQQIRLADVPGNCPVAGDRVLGCLPELGGDERLDGGGDDLVAPLLGLWAALVDPPSELLLAPVDRVDHEVPDPVRAPQPLRPLLPLAAEADEAAISVVVSRHPECVEFPGHFDAAPAFHAEPVVDAAHEVGGGEIGPQERRVGLQVGRAPLANDAIAQGNDAAAVATFPGGPLHPDGRIVEELPPAVRGDDRLNPEAKLVGLALDDADKADAEVREPPPHDQQVDFIAAQPIELEDVNLVDPARGGCAHEPATRRALRDGDRAAHPIVDEALDELDVGQPRE